MLSLDLSLFFHVENIIPEDENKKKKTYPALRAL